VALTPLTNARVIVDASQVAGDFIASLPERRGVRGAARLECRAQVVMTEELALDIEPTDTRRPEARPSVALGAAVRRLRQGRFTLAQLAERSGVSVGLLSLIERGRGNPSINTLAGIAEALDVSLPDLVAAAVEEGTADDGAGLVVTLSDVDADGTGVALPSLQPAAGVVTHGAPSELAAADAAWESRMVLQGGQEARVRVLDGTLELALRDRTAIADAVAGRPLSVDLSLRTSSSDVPASIPPVDDPRWGDLARGEIPFEPSTLAARMLFTHVVRCVRQDPSSPTIERWVRELRGFFVKYESISAPDLAQIFGPDEAA
jgi:transcriptional regulator with XRE-family HTH domain